MTNLKSHILPQLGNTYVGFPHIRQIDNHRLSTTEYRVSDWRKNFSPSLSAFNEKPGQNFAARALIEK